MTLVADIMPIHTACVAHFLTMTKLTLHKYLVSQVLQWSLANQAFFIHFLTILSMARMARQSYAFSGDMSKKSRTSPPGGSHEKKEPGLSTRLLEGGDDLLSRFRSTIGAMKLNFSVRDGKRWILHAIITLMS